jgi:hypothetical protein
MYRDVEFCRQRMLEAQEAFLRYAHRLDRSTSDYAELIHELRETRKDFLDSLDRLRQNPPTHLVSDGHGPLPEVERASIRGPVSAGELDDHEFTA